MNDCGLKRKNKRRHAQACSSQGNQWETSAQQTDVSACNTFFSIYLSENISHMITGKFLAALPAVANRREMQNQVWNPRTLRLLCDESMRHCSAGDTSSATFNVWEWSWPGGSSSKIRNANYYEVPDDGGNRWVKITCCVSIRGTSWCACTAWLVAKQANDVMKNDEARLQGDPGVSTA